MAIWAVYQVGGNTWMVELSDRTCPYLMHHRIGGEPIVPGAWFAEMVLEAAGLPCVSQYTDMTCVYIR